MSESVTLVPAGHPWVYGGRTSRARTVVVYGNCQAPYLAQMLAALDDLNDDYRFVFVANHVFPGESVARPLPQSYLNDVALVLWQHEEGDGNPAAAALRAQLPPGCPVITYPSFLMTCMWPFECPDTRGVPDLAFPYTRYPLGDMLALQVAQSGLTGPLAVAAYMDLSMRKMPNLAVRLKRDLTRMRQHDTRCDVALSDYVEANFRREHLFWTNGHVSREGVCELARRVAAAARHVLGGSAERAHECLARVNGFQGMGGHQHPIHPVVAAALELEFYDLDRTWLWYDQQWTYFEYMERYIAYDTDW